MKKGFTLAELLGVTVLLALIITITYPILFNRVEEQENEMDKMKKELIYNAAENYIKLNSHVYSFEEGDTACVAVKDLIDENLVAIELEESDETKIVKIKQLDNNQYSSSLVDAGEECVGHTINGYVAMEVTSCEIDDDSTKNYELKNKRIQFYYDGVIYRQIDYVTGKNLNSESTVSYENLVNNYSSTNEVIKDYTGFNFFYSKLNKGKDYFNMILDTDMYTYNNIYTDEEIEVLNNTPALFNSDGEIKDSCTYE